MKDRFGRPKGPSKEDIEREAEKELARLTRNVPRPPMGGVSGGGFGGPPGEMATPLDEIASSVRSGRPSAPNLGVLGSVGGGPGGYKGGPGDFDRGLGGYGGPTARRGGATREGPAPGLPADFEDPEEERATITELALRDLAARDGTNPEDLVIRQDPGMAEAMRDEAMRRFMDRQQNRQPAATVAPIDPENTVLGRLAARRKAQEEGRTLDDDEPPSGGGLLDRVRQREEAKAAESRGPTGGRPASVGRLHDRRAGKAAYQVDDDDDFDGSQGLRARVMARRRGETDADNRSGRVFAMPSAEDDDDEPAPVPELAAMATRLSQARAKPSRASAPPAASRKASSAGTTARAAKKARRAAKPVAKPVARTATKPVTKRTSAGRTTASSKRAAGSRAAAPRAASKAAVSKAAVKAAKKKTTRKAAAPTAGAATTRRTPRAAKATAKKATAKKAVRRR